MKILSQTVSYTDTAVHIKTSIENEGKRYERTVAYVQSIPLAPLLEGAIRACADVVVKDQINELLHGIKD